MKTENMLVCPRQRDTVLTTQGVNVLVNYASSFFPQSRDFIVVCGDGQERRVHWTQPGIWGERKPADDTRGRKSKAGTR